MTDAYSVIVLVGESPPAKGEPLRSQALRVDPDRIFFQIVILDSWSVPLFGSNYITRSKIVLDDQSED